MACRATPRHATALRGTARCWPIKMQCPHIPINAFAYLLCKTAWPRAAFCSALSHTISHRHFLASLVFFLKAPPMSAHLPRIASAHSAWARTCAAWKRMAQASPTLAYSGLFMLALSFITLALPLWDERLLQGVSVWHKPWKFQISSAIYTFSLVYFLSLFTQPLASRAAHTYIVLATLVGSVFEVAYITWQGAAGLPSHYNVSTPFYAAMYSAMGVMAVVLTSTAGVLGWQVLRNPLRTFATSAPMRHAIGWGLVITSVLGIVTGGVLGARTRAGGHWVGGTANDALGWAVLNWSRDGGDLRVAHFFAQHAMQILPLLALALALAWPTMRSANGQRSIWLAAAAFSVFCIFTLVQAMLGLPFLG